MVAGVQGSSAADADRPDQPCRLSEGRVTSPRIWQDQASRRQGRSRRPVRPQQRQLLFQTAVPRKAVERCGHTARASDNGPPPPGRYGQNERPAALGRRNALFAGSPRGAQAWAILASLVNTALCRARHRQVYAELRTMPKPGTQSLIPCGSDSFWFGIFR